MKEFINKLVLYVCFVLVFVVAYWGYMHSFLLSHTDKFLPYSHEMNYSQSIEKLKLKTEPSIIIIGGSGCGFGFLSGVLSGHYNMPVINTGTHAGIGLRLILKAVEPYIAEGDIILLIPEYAHFAGSFYWGEEASLRAMYSTYEISGVVSLYQYIHLAKYYPMRYQEVTESQSFSPQKSVNDTTDGSPYSYCSLNEFGDVTFYEKRLHKDSIKITNDGLSRINLYAMMKTKEFIKYAENRGAICVFLPPAYRDLQYDYEEKQISAITYILRNIGIPYQANTSRYRIPDSLHYDTPYHLTYEGCAYRTNLVIEDMDRIISER